MRGKQTPRPRNRAVIKRRPRTAPPSPVVSAVLRAGLELETLQAFRTIFGSARLHDAEVRRTARISGSQLWALSEIEGATGMSVNALAKSMGLQMPQAGQVQSMDAATEPAGPVMARASGISVVSLPN